MLLLLLQVSERVAGAIHTSQLGLVPPELNEQQSQFLWLQPSPDFRGTREDT